MFIIELTSTKKGITAPYVWAEGGMFCTADSAEFHAKQIRKMKDLYSNVEVKFILNEQENAMYDSLMGKFLTNGLLTELGAEMETIRILKKEFPNLKRNLKKHKITTAYINNLGEIKQT